MSAKQFYAINSLWQTQNGAITKPSPVVTIPPYGSYVTPGSVGYQGNISDLTVLTPNGSLPPAISSIGHWTTYGLRIGGSNITLDHIWLTGGLYWEGGGTLTITNSIFTGDTSVSSAYYQVLDASSVDGDNINISDTTFNWNGTYTSLTDIGAVFIRANDTVTMERCDISGMPQGINPSGDNSVIDSCYIHDLIYSGSIPQGTNTHVDGIFPEGGNNVVITRNYVDLSNLTTSVTAPVFFQNIGGTNTGYVVAGNYLDGGSYTYYNETAIGVNVQNNTFGGHPLFGNVAQVGPGTWSVWSGNKTAAGVVVPAP